MKNLNELIDEVMDVEEKASAAAKEYSQQDYGPAVQRCMDGYILGARATGEPLAEALKYAVKALQWSSHHAVVAEIRAILENAVRK